MLPVPVRITTIVVQALAILTLLAHSVRLWGVLAWQPVQLLRYMLIAQVAQCAALVPPPPPAQASAHISPAIWLIWQMPQAHVQITTIVVQALEIPALLGLTLIRNVLRQVAIVE